MSLSISPTDQDIFLALWSFLRSILPSGDAVFAGSLSGDTLTVSKVVEGSINIGDPILGPNVAPGTTIAAYGPNTSGLAGTYSITPAYPLEVSSSTLSTGVDILQAQTNRVPEPVAQDFITMTFLRLPRLSTNFEAYADLTFTGAIDGKILTVASISDQIALELGSPVFGIDVLAGTSIRAFASGEGGTGTYVIAPPQTVAARAMAAGLLSMRQASQVVIQLDVHGPNAANFAQIISTAFRSSFAVDLFAGLNEAIAPLFADDPRQAPFINAEQQLENRYVVEANMQVNQTVTIGQQFADDLQLALVNIEAAIPTPPPSGDPSLDFSDPDNSMYLPGL